LGFSFFENNISGDYSGPLYRGITSLYIDFKAETDVPYDLFAISIVDNEVNI